MVVSGPAVQGCRSDSTAAVHFDGFKSVGAAAVAPWQPQLEPRSQIDGR